MSDYVIITDATSELVPAMLSEIEVQVIPMPFSFDGESFMHYSDAREMGCHDFYERLRGGEMPSTAQINPQLYLDYFEKPLKEGLDVLYIGFSSGLTGSLSNASIVIDELKTTYPERRIIMVDSLCASIGEGFLVYHAALERLKGKSLEEAAAYVEENKLKVNHWFTVSDLNHLKRGGRISSASAFAGTLMGIRPLLSVDNEGKLYVKDKIRGETKALQTLISNMEKLAVNPEEQTIFIGHGDCLSEAEKLADMVREKFNVKNIIIDYVGPIIGAHTGPGMVALIFFGETR